MTVHAHGTAQRIATGCGCNLCTLVRSNPRAATLAPSSVPTGRIRAHIEALLVSGWSVRELAEKSGYPPSTLYAIRNGRWQFTSRYIAEDILSVPIKEAAA